MSENAVNRLGQALADRYRIERELGQGGIMADTPVAPLPRC